MQQLEEDRSDVIAHLKRNLQYKNEEAQELNERLFALEELRKEEITKFRQKEEELEENYRTMENNLSTEIQLAGTKKRNKMKNKKNKTKINKEEFI